MNLIGLPNTQLLPFLLRCVTWRCVLDLWPFDLGVMSRDATWVFTPRTMIELDKIQRCDLWPWWRKEKKRQKLSCVKLAICPYHPRRHRPLKFCIRGRVREVVIYFKFHENRLRGLRAVGVENFPLLLTWLKAYTRACTAVYDICRVAQKSKPSC